MKILSNYNLGEYKSSRQFVTGKVQTNYLLQTSIGKYVFRYYENRSVNSVLFESSLIKYLNDNNYPCPSQVENLNRKLISNYNQKPYIIFEYIKGKHLKNPDENQKRQIARKAAELHDVTKNFKLDSSKYRLNYNIDTCIKLAREKAKIYDANSSREKLKWIKGELQKLKLPKSLPRGICHCDFHFSNVLFLNKKFNALIDFDDANYTFSIFDLANLINPFVKSFEWNTWSSFKKDENVFDFSNARKTVSEYMKHRHLTEAEKKHLFDVYKLSILFDCIWYFERGNALKFYEKRKIEYLNSIGREYFYNKLFK